MKTNGEKVIQNTIHLKIIIYRGETQGYIPLSAGL